MKVLIAITCFTHQLIIIFKRRNFNKERVGDRFLRRSRQMNYKVERMALMSYSARLECIF
jgi:hypothetical protein